MQENQLASSRRPDEPDVGICPVRGNDFYSLHRNGANLTEMCELHKVSESAAKGELF